MSSELIVSGTEGYTEEADGLLRRYETISFTDTHRWCWHLLPTNPSRILDIGSGSGRDAAGFAALGHTVVAVEPTAALRAGSAALHPSPRIEWLDDSLPDLRVIVRRGETFDAVMLTAVWMHLDASQRARAMSTVATLVRPCGAMMLWQRHGPVPAGRRMFDVAPQETVALAAAVGLECVLNFPNGDSLWKRPDVRWDRLAFIRL